MDCKHGHNVSFCPDISAIWHPPYYSNGKQRNLNTESKPTEEERRQAEVEAFKAGKRYSTAQIPHMDDCECPKCKPENWT